MKKVQLSSTAGGIANNPFMKGNVTKQTRVTEVNTKNSDPSLSNNAFLKKQEMRGEGVLSPQPNPKTNADREKRKENDKYEIQQMKDLDPSLVGHMTLNVPPPPGMEEKLKARIDAIKAGAEVPAVGDTKKALDQMRDHLLTFYSGMYSSSNGNIANRLEQLKERSKASDVDYDRPAEVGGVYVDSPLKASRQKKLYGSVSDNRRSQGRHGDEGVLEVLSELTAQVKELENRINDNSSSVALMTEDPTLRTFFTNGDKSIHPQEAFSNSCKSLYTHLKVRSANNEKKIEALQSRLRVMQIKLQEDRKSTLGAGVDSRRGG